MMRYTYPKAITLALTGCVLLMAGVSQAAAESDQTQSQSQATSQSHRLCPICAATNKDTSTYLEKAGNTFVRGAMNVGFGWTEFIFQPVQEAKSGGNLVAGIASGVGHSVTRTLGGVAELLTFWTPKLGNTYLHFNKDCPLDTSR